MKTKIFLSFLGLSLVALTIFNLDLVPLRREISDMQIVMVAGLDSLENGYEISFLKREEQPSTSGGATGESSTNTQVVSIVADSFNSAMNHLQSITDKYITTSHIKYYIIGEESMKNDFTHIVDTLSRGNQIRFNAKIYVSKSMTAKEFLERTSNTDYKVEDKLYNMEDNFLTERVSTDTDIINLRHIAMNEEKSGMIASLEFGESEDSDKETEIELSDEPAKKNKKETPFGFGGAGIIQNMRLVGYLSTNETAIVNYIKYKNSVNLIKIKDENDFVSFGVEQINVDTDFNFDNDGIINELIFNVKFKANYEEVKSNKTIFDLKSVKAYEKKLNETVEKQLREIVKKELEMNTDFIGLMEKLELKHPFKFEKNKDEFISNLKKCKITVISKGMIQTTYDVTETNIYQEGDRK